MMIVSLQRDPNQQPRKIEKINLSGITDQNNLIAVTSVKKDSRNLAINSMVSRPFLKKEEIKRNHNEVPLIYHEEDSMNSMLVQLAINENSHGNSAIFHSE
jgi:hypothetical protein